MTVTINGSAGVTTNSGAVYDSLQRGTAVTASGTSVDFTSIPSWVRRITVMFSGISTNGASLLLVQLGDSGGVETTGYVSSGGLFNNANATSVSSSTAGFIMAGASAAGVRSGHLIITNMTGNQWVSSHSMKFDTTNIVTGGGDKTLSDVLTQVRITTVNGTDTFDAGTINIIYE